jgi:hypothetical protein
MEKLDMRRSNPLIRIFLGISLILPQLSVTVLPKSTIHYDITTGQMVGRVLDQNHAPLAGARVRVINQDTGNPRATTTDATGRYQVAYLQPGRYTVEVSHPNYELLSPTAEPIKVQLNRTIETLPDIIMRAKIGVVAQTPTQPTQPVTPPVAAPPTAAPVAMATPTPTVAPDESTGRLTNGQDATRRFNADERMITQLPLAGVRTFDDLAFLFPGVALPPAVQGVAGPGIGAGIGTAGQFSVHGMRARSNNFTVDGSDNNDDDVGVRRQGFVSLVPQSIESIQDFQIATSLWDAEFGRSMGSQVNAVSRSGGREVHGSFYDFFNHDALNARNFFDYNGAGTSFPLRALSITRYANGTPVNPAIVPVRVGGPAGSSTGDFVQPSPSGGENKLIRNMAGMTISVPFSRKLFGPAGSDSPTRTFFFGSFERQIVRAQQETHFSVPTVEERGFLNFGATGFFATDRNNNQRRFFPTFLAGDAVYSLFPLPNNPIGPYGRNTLTQVLGANAEGTIFSLKFDHNFTMFGPEVTHQFTARYNFTNDDREVPAVGGAIAGGIKPYVGTQNITLFLNSQLSLNFANQLRGSYGRTRLRFDPIASPGISSSDALPGNGYLLNARRLANFSNPQFPTPYVDYRLAPAVTNANTGLVFRPVEDALGSIGQVIIAPYSPVGVDPYLFPQARTNNTYQIADTLTYFRGNHSFKFGADIRRTQLNSFLDRNYRTQVTFGGTLDLTGVFDTRFPSAQIPFPNLSKFGPTPGYFRGTDLASLGIPTGIFQGLSGGTPDSTIGLRFWQHNFFINDSWRARPGLSIDWGLRYEYNTVPREVNNRIEQTFSLAGLPAVDPNLGVSVSYVDEDGNFSIDPAFPNANLLAAFAQTRKALEGIIGGRTTIFEPDRNNFAPHLGIAWDPWHASPTQAGKTVIRAGFGVYYDVALGSVVSQSRNVFPTFIPMNLDVNTFNNMLGVFDQRFFDQNSANNGNGFLRIINPTYLPIVVVDRNGKIQPLSCPNGNVNQGSSILCPGTLNRVGLQSGAAQALLGLLLNPLGTNLPGQRQSGGGLAFTLPDKNLRSPYSYQYNFQIEREFARNFLFNVAYVGTRGLKLTRFRTPNGGVNSPTFPVDPLQIDPQRSLVPAVAYTPSLFPLDTGFRKDSRLGAYTIFDSSADSSYHSLQTSLTKRFNAGYQFTAAYTWAHAIDDVSDVFDVGGAFTLPQNDSNLEAERASANYDVRHRFAFSTVAEFPGLRRFNLTTGAKRFWLGGWQMSSIVVVQSGQPFTVNTSFDTNLDGNLTDRLNTTNGLQITDDRRQPIVVTTANLASLLPSVVNSVTGTVTPADGAVGRNTFRASGIFKVDFTVMKSFRIKEGQELLLRVEAFNAANRTHFAIPVRILESPSFGQAVSTSLNPRQIQVALKYQF